MVINKNNEMEKNEIELIIRNYFGEHKYVADVFMMAGIANVSIEYMDFKPKNVVIRDLMDLIPNIDFGNVERNYSDETLMKEARLMYGCSDLHIWIEDSPGRLRKVDFGLYIEERLMNKEL